MLREGTAPATAPEARGPAKHEFPEYGPWTPVPNACFDRMPRLSDTEWRLLLAVVRQTLGWHRERDWLSRRRLAALTGRSERAVSAALDGLVRRNLVAVHGGAGERLDTPQARRAAGRLWLSLGERLRGPSEDGTARPGPAREDGHLAALARAVFDAPAKESPSEETSLDRSGRATPGAESTVTFRHCTKETQGKRIAARAFQKEDTGRQRQPWRPTLPTPATFSPTTREKLARFARYERESTGKRWHWDAAIRKWVRTAGEHGAA